jgi:hypothetical protein
MNLLQVRTKFRELSGRFDLVNADFTDNGADFFINEGCKYLDRLDETNKSTASCFRFVEIGGFSAVFPRVRALREVYGISASGTQTGRWKIEKEDLSSLIEAYLSELTDDRIPGYPSLYAPCITRYIPDTSEIDNIEAFVSFMEIPSGHAEEYNAILLNCPVETKIMLDLRGLFYSPELVEDTDTNIWSANHPLTLIEAAMMQCEGPNRNTQGYKDLAMVVGDTVRQLGFDKVEEDIAGVEEMEG